MLFVLFFFVKINPIQWTPHFPLHSATIFYNLTSFAQRAPSEIVDLTPEESLSSRTTEPQQKKRVFHMTSCSSYGVESAGPQQSKPCKFTHLVNQQNQNQTKTRCDHWVIAAIKKGTIPPFLPFTSNLPFCECCPRSSLEKDLKSSRSRPQSVSVSDCHRWCCCWPKSMRTKKASSRWNRLKFMTRIVFVLLVIELRARPVDPGNWGRHPRKDHGTKFFFFFFFEVGGLTRKVGKGWMGLCLEKGEERRSKK